MTTHILVIDDDVGTCETLSDVLSAKGHAVRTATRGRAALAPLATEPVDIAIVDIKLPDIPGLELLDEIKRGSSEGFDDKMRALLHIARTVQRGARHGA